MLFVRRNLPALLTILVGVALGSGVTAYFYHRGRIAPPYVLSFTYTKIPITAPELSATPALRLFAAIPQGDARSPRPADETPQPVRNLVAIKVQVRNNGPQPVRRTDYESPLQLYVKPPARLLPGALGDVSRSDLRPVLTQEAPSATNTGPVVLEIGPVVLEPEDHFSVDLIIADDPRPHGTSPPLVLSGHIVGVTDYALRTPQAGLRPFGPVSGVLLTAAILVPVLAVGALAFYLWHRYPARAYASRALRHGQAAPLAEDIGIDEIHRIADLATSSLTSVGRLMRIATAHPTPRVRAAALERLGYLIGAHYHWGYVARQVLQLLTQALASDLHPDARGAAILALRQTGMGARHAAVTEAARSDPDPRVRWVAGLATAEPEAQSEER